MLPLTTPSAKFRKRRYDDVLVEPTTNFVSIRHGVTTPPISPFAAPVSNRNNSKASFSLSSSITGSACLALNSDDCHATTSTGLTTPTTPGKPNKSSSTSPTGYSPSTKKRFNPSILELHLAQNTARKMMQAAKDLQKTQSRSISSSPTRFNANNTDASQQREACDAYSDDDSFEHILATRAFALPPQVKIRTIDSYFPAIGVSRDVAKAAAQDADSALSDADDSAFDSDIDVPSLEEDDDGDFDMIGDTNCPPSSLSRRNSTSNIKSLDLDCYFNDLDYSHRLTSSVSTPSVPSPLPHISSSYPMTKTTKKTRNGKTIAYNQAPTYLASSQATSIPNSSLFSCADCFQCLSSSNASVNLIDHIRSHQCLTCKEILCDSCLARNVQTEDGEYVETECFRCLRKRL